MQPHPDNSITTQAHKGEAAPVTDTPEPLRRDTEGNPVFAQWDESDPLDVETIEEFDTDWEDSISAEIISEDRKAEIARLDKMTDSELMIEAGIDPVVSTTEAAEYFERTNQWLYWGLRQDSDTGVQIFVWPDGSPIIPERIGDPKEGRRRFTMPILRAIMTSCYSRGNLEPEELTKILRRIRYTELGVEWREREGWKYADLGRGRHRWIKPEKAWYDPRVHGWKLKRIYKLETDQDPKEALPVTDEDFIDVEVVSMDNEL